VTSSLCVQFMYWFCMLYKQGLKAGYLCSYQQRDPVKYHGCVSEIISLVTSIKSNVFLCKLHTIQCLISHILFI